MGKISFSVNPQADWLNFWSNVIGSVIGIVGAYSVARWEFNKSRQADRKRNKFNLGTKVSELMYLFQDFERTLNVTLIYSLDDNEKNNIKLMSDAYEVSMEKVNKLKDCYGLSEEDILDLIEFVPDDFMYDIRLLSTKNVKETLTPIIAKQNKLYDEYHQSYEKFLDSDRSDNREFEEKEQDLKRGFIEVFNEVDHLMDFNNWTQIYEHL